MSLGQQLAPHLPFLRRFARALTGSQFEGDKFVRLALEAIVSEPDQFPRDVEPRLGLYRTFLDLWRRNVETRFRDKEALLLTAVEGFTPEEASWLLDVSETEIGRLVSRALREVEKQNSSRVLIVEDEPIVAMDIEAVVRELGHDVTAVAITRAEAVEFALRDRPSLLLVDISLADGSSGIEAVEDILASFKVPVIFITAFPERLLVGERPEPTFLITKPFQRSTLRAAITQALFIEQQAASNSYLEIADSPSTSDGSSSLSAPQSSITAATHQPTALDLVNLEPLPAPVDAAVIGGRLRMVGSTSIHTRVGPNRIATLWRLHAATAERIATELAGSNAGRAFVARVQAVRHTLASTPNDNDALAIGVQSHGLAAMLPTVREMLMDDVAGDIAAFLSDLRQLANHFESYREFVGEAEQAPPLPSEQEAALATTARLLEAASDEAVDPELKESIADVRSNAEETPDPIANFALLRTIGNVLKGLGRYLRDLSKDASKRFAEETGGAVGKLTIKLIKSGALLGLAHFMPVEFGWVLNILAFSQLIQHNDDNNKRRDK